MKFSCEKQLLSDAVSTVIKATSSKSSIPILEGILLSTDDDKLVLTTNNLEMGMECTISAEVSQNGSIVIGDAKVFAEIIRKLPNDIIYIEVSDNMTTTIKCQKSVYNIIGLNPVEFPELPEVRETASLVINGDVLKSMLRQTIYAVSTRTEKPVLTGALFDISESFLTVAALDGFRLAIRKEKVENAKEGKFIVPGKTLNDLIRTLKDEELPVTIKMTDKYILFEYENTKIISRLIDGEFFNYKAIIPKDFKIKTKVFLSDIISCVERADPIVSVDVLKNPIKMTINRDTLSIDCMTATGKVYDIIEIEDCGGELEIGFNQKYLHDALASCEDENIFMEFNGSLNPCIIKPAEGDAFLFMVLPVMLKND